mmetsp:Transcript_16502/g.31621  ORF Transcript_16502/g.31621 Transcript_16502/m.31621 type:complete len:85 (-) Transcript_16502:163-417(-)
MFTILTWALIWMWNEASAQERMIDPDIFSIVTFLQDIPGAYNSIRQHAWFSNLNWNALEKGLNTPQIFAYTKQSMYKPMLEVHC